MTTTPRRRTSPWRTHGVRCLDCRRARALRVRSLRWYCAAGTGSGGRIYEPGFACAEDEGPGGGFDIPLLRPRTCYHFESNL